MSGPTANDPEEAYAAALSGLPGMGPATLVSLLGGRRPSQVWADIRAGRTERPPTGGRAAGRPAGSAEPRRGPAGGQAVQRGGPAAGQGVLSPELVPPAPSRPWAQAAAAMEPPRWWARRAATGVRVTWYGAASYPSSLVADPQPPGVLFWRGSLDWLRHPCVAIVGTRNATPDGRRIAFEMGRDLAAAGICVVSGLALGIDGAAHQGALQAQSTPGNAGPIGVAASGVDVAYPKRHRDLWEKVAQHGALLSEALPGRPAEAWRFPFRNRIIAGLSRLVVVVESHARGGSLITAEAALERGVEVRVVPGPVHSPACAGSNQLLYDGPGPVRHARDVLDALGVVRPSHAGPPAAGHEVVDAAIAGLDGLARSVVDALGWRPRSLGDVMSATGLSLAEASRALDVLQAHGLVKGERGWWTRSGTG